MEIPEKLRYLVPEGLRESPLGKGAVTAGLVLLGSRWLLSKISDHRETRELAEKREGARQYKRKTVDRVSSALAKEDVRNENGITKIPPLELVNKIKSGEYTAVQVLRAFQAEALECDRRTNAVCFFYEDAEQWAKECDDDPKKEGRFFGLPVSVKDRYCIKGYDRIMGYSRNIGHPSTETGLIVKIMRREGAVPFVQTNVPQTMMSFESSNPVFGATVNPFNPTRGPGGSSSGEGAIVGYGASPLGLGSDVAGSVRVPAAFCGCVGFKPTTYRISAVGNPPAHPGESAICGTLGPLTPDVETTIEFCKAIWDHNEMFDADTAIPPLRFNYQLFETPRPLRIGMYINLGTQKPVPAVYRSMEMAKAALEAQGHMVIEWTPPEVHSAFKHVLTILNKQWTQQSADKLCNDRLDYSVAHFLGKFQQPKCYAIIKAWLQDFYDPAAAFETRSVCKTMTALDYWNEYESVMAFHGRVSSSWREAGLDACIGPSFPFPSMPLVKTGDMSTEELYWVGATYTFLFNVLNMPAGAVPVTKVTDKDVEEMVNYPTKTRIDRAICEGMEGATGLPVSCQVVASRFRDEMVLRVMKDLETGLKSNNTIG